MSQYNSNDPTYPTHSNYTYSNSPSVHPNHNQSASAYNYHPTAPSIPTSGASSNPGPPLKRRRTCSPHPRPRRPPPQPTPCALPSHNFDADMAAHRPSYQPLAGARKLVIKNRRDPANAQQKVQEYFEKTWAELSTAINVLLYGKQLTTPLDRLCRGVEAICRDGHVETLYKRLGEHTQMYLTATVHAAINHGGEEQTNRQLLQAVVQNWNVWKERTRLIRSMFSYLDRAHLQRDKTLPCLNDMMTSQFRRLVFPNVGRSTSSRTFNPDDGSLAAAVAIGTCELTDNDRDQDGKFDGQLFNDTVSMLHSLGVYNKVFERMYIIRASQYFTEMARRWHQMTLTDFMSSLNDLFHRELKRCDLYGLDAATRFRLMDRFFHTMVPWPLERVLEPGALGELLRANDMYTLNGMYILFLGAKKSQVPDIMEQLEVPWRNYIISTGSALLRDAANADTIIPEILRLKNSMQRVARVAFEDNEIFLQSLRDALSTFINDQKNMTQYREGVSKIGEFAAKYMDTLLRNGIKGVPPALLADALEDNNNMPGSGDDEAQLDYHLDQALQLFRLIQGKDAFEAFYKRDLARRLLMDRSLSYDAERTMLARLRSECGISFTHNLEGMFKDKEMNKDEMANFKTWCDASGTQPQLDTHVLVLSAVSWPSYPDVKVELAPAAQQSLETFEEFYRTNHTGRRLAWKHGLGHCVLRGHFDGGVKELNVSLLQATVLLMFNQVPAAGFLTYAQLVEQTKLSGDDLDRTLQSLACGRYRVLTKHPRGRDVKPEDTFSFNNGFTDAKYKLKINQIQLRETADDVELVHKRVVADRRLETQAAIVRIMKSRKTLGHSVLVAEVINMMKTRGTVDPAAIKQEIELLIDRDYMEREGNEYVYIA